jgi:hypothetical protein
MVQQCRMFYLTVIKPLELPDFEVSVKSGKLFPDDFNATMIFFPIQTE